MSNAHVGRRSARALGILATVSAALPLGLTGCSTTPGLSNEVSEMHVSAEPDLLEMPTEQLYDVTGASLIEPRSAAAFGDSIDGSISASGHLALRDGVITSAEFTVSAAELPEATFVLTEPAVLGRAVETGGTVTAIGTLAFDGRERPNTGVEITPTLITDEEAEFDVRLSIPDNPLAAGAMLPFDEIAAHFSFTAH